MRLMLSGLLVILLAGLVGVAGPRIAEASAPPEPAPPATNDFIPEDQNLSDCVGTLQRPGCGSESKGGWQTYLAFGILLAAMAFIGWRIVRSVRARDAAMMPPPD